MLGHDCLESGRIPVGRRRKGEQVSAFLFGGEHNQSVAGASLYLECIWDIPIFHGVSCTLPHRILESGRPISF